MTEKNEMNKQQALEKLAALEAETKALRAIIEAPDPAGSLLPSVWGQYTCQMLSKDAFNSNQEMVDYVQAIDTMIQLRRQPGSETPKDGVSQWIINCDVLPSSYFIFRTKIALTSPCFATEEQAGAAIQKVGEERIRHMFNTLHGVK